MAALLRSMYGIVVPDSSTNQKEPAHTKATEATTTESTTGPPKEPTTTASTSVATTDANAATAANSDETTNATNGSSKADVPNKTTKGAESKAAKAANNLVKPARPTAETPTKALEKSCPVGEFIETFVQIFEENGAAKDVLVEHLLDANTTPFGDKIQRCGKLSLAALKKMPIVKDPSKSGRPLCKITVQLPGSTSASPAPTSGQQISEKGPRAAFLARSSSSDGGDALAQHVRKEVVKRVVGGGNACVMVMGATDSGKTQLFASSADREALVSKTLRALVTALEASSSTWSLGLKIVQLHAEAVAGDLLAAHPGVRADAKVVRRGEVKVEGVTRKVVHSGWPGPADALVTICKQSMRARESLESARMSGSEPAHNSDAHTVVWVEVASSAGDRGPCFSRLLMVEVAGTEKLNEDKLKLGVREPQALGRSLFTLASMAQRMATQEAESSAGAQRLPGASADVAAMQSKSLLTRLLGDAIGGDCYTLGVAVVKQGCPLRNRATLQLVENLGAIRNFPVDWTQDTNGHWRQLMKSVHAHATLARDERDATKRDVRAEKDNAQLSEAQQQAADALSKMTASYNRVVQEKNALQLQLLDLEDKNMTLQERQPRPSVAEMNEDEDPPCERCTELEEDLDDVQAEFVAVRTNFIRLKNELDQANEKLRDADEKAKVKADADAKAEAMSKARARARAHTDANAAERARAEARAKAEVEARTKEEAEARATAKAQTMLRTLMGLQEQIVHKIQVSCGPGTAEEERLHVAEAKYKVLKQQHQELLRLSERENTDTSSWTELLKRAEEAVVRETALRQVAEKRLIVYEEYMRNTMRRYSERVMELSNPQSSVRASELGV